MLSLMTGTLILHNQSESFSVLPITLRSLVGILIKQKTRRSGSPATHIWALVVQRIEPLLANREIQVRFLTRAYRRSCPYNTIACEICQQTSVRIYIRIRYTILMKEIQSIQLEKLHRGLALIIETKEGIETYKISISIAKRLMERLFRVVSPDWGGEREGAGKRKDEE